MSKLNAPSVRGALAALSLTMLLPSFGTSGANVALPTLAKTFNASFQEVQGTVLAYLLATTSLIVSAGRLGDMIGRRRLLLAGLFLFTTSSLICGSASTLWLLIAGRAVQGVGAAVMMALAVAFVGETVAKEWTGRSMGLLGAMSAIGTTLGPSLGGFLIAGLGWQAIFLFNAPLGIAAYFLVHRYLPLDRRHSSVSWTSLDVKGTLLLSLTLGVYALSVTAGRAGFGAFNLALLAAAGVGLTLFVRAEAAAPSPLIHLALFRQPALGASLAMSSLVSTVMMATLVVGPFYLSRALALDAGLVGLAMAAGPLVAALAAMPSGRLVDRIGPEKTTLAGLTCIAAGCSAVSLSPAALGIGGYTVPLIVITAGYALFQTANNTRVMKDIRPDQRGVISGMLNLSRNLGLITGSSVMGAIFAVAAATTSIASADRAAVAFGMRATFAVSAVLVAGTLAIAIGSHARFPRDCASQ